MRRLSGSSSTFRQTYVPFTTFFGGTAIGQDPGDAQSLRDVLGGSPPPGRARQIDDPRIPKEFRQVTSQRGW